MLQILQVTEPDRVKAYCEKTGLLYQADMQAFDALDQSGVCGFCVFRFEEGMLHIKGVYSEPVFGTSLYDGLLRAVMNCASSSGISEVCLDESIGETVFRQIEPLHFTKKSPIVMSLA